MDSSQQQAVIDFAIERIDRDELFRRLRVDESSIPEQVRRSLVEATASKDGDAVEAALTLGFLFAMPENIVDLVHGIILEQWHSRHEDMIRILQDAADPRSVEVLRQALQLKPKLGYLDFDDYGSYYKKCLWALQSIGDEDATDVIRACAESQDDALRSQALYRLKRQQERGREDAS